MRNDLKAKQRQLVFDPLLNRQPVKRMKYRNDVGGSGCFENESCSIVLYLLEFRKKILRTARQKRERVGSTQTPRLQTVLASLMSQPSRFMNCGQSQS